MSDSALHSDTDDAPPRRVRPYVSEVRLSSLEETLGVAAAYRATDPPLTHPPRRVLRPLVLFTATCVSTFFAGVTGWSMERFFWDFPNLLQTAMEATSLTRGLEYMVAVMGILMAHEMGHFLMTVRYRIAASYPMFIPVPFFMGTMGAVIAMDGPRANRKQLFDIGIAGPLAGLAVILPILGYGIYHATALPIGPHMKLIGDPLLVDLMKSWLRPELGSQHELLLNPWLMAGWVGCLVTGLNMFPLSQLDGGHVLYCLLGKRAHYVARTILMTSIAAMVVTDNYTWTLMLVLVTFLGVDHPPTADDHVPLGRFRTILGFASLAIPILCFIPKVG